MGKVVNLRRTARRRARDAARAEADANAARHGETGAARRLRETEARLEARRLEGHRRDDTEGET
ncbi:MAG TPA: DUF4169 family protein [Thermohalobaculum sp.]|nr:DUF4169 family protein [Thermohalobaculum sp.]